MRFCLSQLQRHLTVLQSLCHYLDSLIFQFLDIQKVSQHMIWRYQKVLLFVVDLHIQILQVDSFVKFGDLQLLMRHMPFHQGIEFRQ